MKRAGRASPILILGIASILGIIVMLFFAGGGPLVPADKFMEALKGGDVDTLTKHSYIDGNTPEQVKEKWTFTMTKVAPHFRFVSRMGQAKQLTEDTAVVKVEVIRDVLGAAPYPETYELPMILVDGEWKVDVAQMERKMFPGLPR
ncbi:MAG TPA: hypothetical protein PKA27_05590 [Fimbriimonadaceae bacterium]|nr:hypothetical protein [Fimbriimonadaceae bacterium]